MWTIYADDADSGAGLDKLNDVEESLPETRKVIEALAIRLSQPLLNRKLE
jgi:hypothetical protein